LLGAAGAWIVPLLLAIWAVNRARESPPGPSLLRSLILIALAIVCITALSLLHDSSVADGVYLPGEHAPPAPWGGAVGHSLALVARSVLGPVGAHLAVWSAALALGIVALEITWPAPVNHAARALLAGAI